MEHVHTDPARTGIPPVFPEARSAFPEALSAFPEDPVSRAAARTFGIRYLYPMQRLVIANILDAAAEMADAAGTADAAGAAGTADPHPFARQIVLLPTGAGKSFCFLVPALLLDGPTLIIYPLLSLMADQKRRLDEAGIACVVLAGGQERGQREKAFRSLEAGKVRIVLANPEVLLQEPVLSRLASCRIAHVVVDEAHCVGDWGDSFRPAYLRLGAVLQRLAPRVATAFTATASDAVVSRIQEVLFGGEAFLVRGNVDRPNIRYAVMRCLHKKKAALRLAVSCQRPLIIFCGTRYKAEDMAREIAALLGPGTVRFYHAGMEREEKRAVESFFFASSDGILCATCAYGMGVDKPDVRTVVHLESPLTVEAYVQESGRAGRDGKPADAILLWSPADRRKFASFAVTGREHWMLRYAEAVSCRRQILLRALGSEGPEGPDSDASGPEAAACSSCDVCDRGGGPAPAAYDGKRALDFILRHRKLYDWDSLSAELIRQFNRADLPLFQLNVWEHSDIACIMEALQDEGLIRRCSFPWRGRVDCKAP